MVCVPLRPCTSAVHLPLKSAAKAATEPSAKNKTVSPSFLIIRTSPNDQVNPGAARTGRTRSTVTLAATDKTQEVAISSQLLAFSLVEPERTGWFLDPEEVSTAGADMDADS